MSADHTAPRTTAEERANYLRNTEGDLGFFEPDIPFTRRLIADVNTLTTREQELVAALERYGNAGQLARSFHATYEFLAPDFGYKTRNESAVHWADVPDKNKKLMIATARLLGTAARDALAGRPPDLSGQPSGERAC